MANLIIPMAGQGQRFKDAGYRHYKPFIPILDKPMIQYIIDNCQGYTGRTFVIASEGRLTTGDKAWLRDRDVELIYIESHKMGPAYSIFAACDRLPLQEAALISYVDIHWKWPEGFCKEDLDARNIVFTCYGHPHLINNPASAFCQLQEGNRIVRIREKSPFTDDWLNEPLSVGAFSFSRLADLVDGVRENIKAQDTINDEYFPTVAVAELLEKLHFEAVEVESFVHWGTPEQLEDFVYWQCSLEEKSARQSKPTGVVYCTGKGSRMRGVHNEKKPFIQVTERHRMFELVIEQLALDRPQVVVTAGDESYVHAQPHRNLVSISETDSQVESLIASAPYIDQSAPLFLASCDCYGSYNRARFEVEKSRGADVIIFSYFRTLTQRKLGNQHTSIIKTGTDKVEIKVKSGEATDPGFAGFIWVRDPTAFFDTCSDPRLTEFAYEPTLDHVVALMAADKAYRISVVPLEKYIHLGTREELLEYQFWSKARLI